MIGDGLEYYLLYAYAFMHVVAFVLLLNKTSSFIKACLHPMNIFYCVSYGHYFLSFLRGLSTPFPATILLLSALVMNTTLLVVNYKLEPAFPPAGDAPAKKTRYDDKLLFGAALALLFVGVAAFNYLLNSLGINIFQYFLGLSYYYKTTRQGTAWVFIVITFSTIGSILYFACASKLKPFNVVALIVATSFLSLTTGGRSSAIIYVFEVAAVLLTRSARTAVVSKPVKKKSQVLLVGLLLAIAVSVYVKNTTSRLNVNLDEYLTDVVIIDFDKGLYLDTFRAKYPDSVTGEYHGRTLLDLAQFFIPRAWNPDKEISTYGTRDLNPVAAESGSNDTFGFIPLAYFNFGVAGVVFETIAFTVFYCWAYKSLLSFNRDSDLWKKAGFAIFIGNEYILLNGGILTHFVFILSMQVLCLYLLSRIVSFLSRLRRSLARPRRKGNRVCAPVMPGPD